MSLKHVLLISASLAFFSPVTANAQMGTASEPAATTTTAATPVATTAATPAITPMVTPAATGTAEKMQAPKDNVSPPVTHAEFDALVKKALLNDPEIIMEAVKRLHDKHMEQANKEMRLSLDKHKDELVNDTQSPSVGDAKTADVTIVEFFDYHCGYCKHMLPAVTQLLHDDKKVRFIFREFPILAEDSVAASRAAIAVYKINPEKYFEFHTALMKSNGKFDEKTLFEIAKKVGVDPKKMKKEMENPEITQILDSTRALADDIGIRGTPALYIGGELFPGALPYDDLEKVVEKVRKGEDPSAVSKTDVMRPPMSDEPRATNEPVPSKE